MSLCFRRYSKTVSKTKCAFGWGFFNHNYCTRMRLTVCMQTTEAKEEVSLWPDLPNKARVSQERALIGFQWTGLRETKQSKEMERLKMNGSKITQTVDSICSKGLQQVDMLFGSSSHPSRPFTLSTQLSHNLHRNKWDSILAASCFSNICFPLFNTFNDLTFFY